MLRSSYAPGKIILSGEYAVVFGYPGIAVPAPVGITVTFEEDASLGHLIILGPGTEHPLLHAYIERIIALCDVPNLSGTLRIVSMLPFGKGMGSSSALVIAIARILIGDDRAKALQIEDTVNPGHSGQDFNTIWENHTFLFRKGMKPERIELPENILQGATLIDTGMPSGSTAQLVAWMKETRAEKEKALQAIGQCTERLLKGETLPAIMRDHNKAQCELGVVPRDIAKMISEIEKTGGSAKVLGAGSRAGGAGTVLALGDRSAIQKIAQRRNMPTMHL